LLKLVRQQLNQLLQLLNLRWQPLQQLVQILDVLLLKLLDLMKLLRDDMQCLRDLLEWRPRLRRCSIRCEAVAAADEWIRRAKALTAVANSLACEWREAAEGGLRGWIDRGCAGSKRRSYQLTHFRLLICVVESTALRVVTRALPRVIFALRER